MTDKLVRFLNSIEIYNVDDFDIEFDMICKNRFNPKKYDMMIVKQTPWTYERIRQFQDALVNIDYPYSLMFSYKERPSGVDVVHLFNDWYQTIYRTIPKLKFLADEKRDGYIDIIYPNEISETIYKEAIKDFKDFLSFLNYEFVFTESVQKEEEIIQIDKVELNKIVEEAKEEAEQIIEETAEEEEINDRNEILDKIEEERKSLDLQIEETLLEEMQRNKREMDKERERMRRNKRGAYSPIDHIKDIVDTTNNVDFSGKVYKIEEKVFGNTRVRVQIGVRSMLS